MGWCFFMGLEKMRVAFLLSKSERRLSLSLSQRRMETVEGWCWFSIFIIFWFGIFSKNNQRILAFERGYEGEVWKKEKLKKKVNKITLKSMKTIINERRITLTPHSTLTVTLFLCVWCVFLQPWFYFYFFSFFFFLRKIVTGR